MDTQLVVAERPQIDAIERLESALLRVEQVDVPLVHRFAPGVYMREVLMPAGSFVIGHRHKTKHFNIISKGRCSVMMDGKVTRLEGPCTIVSEPGVRKVLYIHEDTLWATIHPTDETDVEKLEAQLVEESESFREYELEVEQLKRVVAAEAKGVLA